MALRATPNGYIIFDDTVLDKRSAQDIVFAQKQYSGNAHATINSIGVVTCVSVNPALDWYWIIDFRIYDKSGDGKSKLDHVQDMLDVLVNSRNNEKSCCVSFLNLNHIAICSDLSNSRFSTIFGEGLDLRNNLFVIVQFIAPRTFQLRRENHY